MIYLKDGDSIVTAEGRYEITGYQGNGIWVVDEYRDVFDEEDDPMASGEVFAGHYTITRYDLQRHFYEATGRICCFYPETEEEVEEDESDD